MLFFISSVCAEDKNNNKIYFTLLEKALNSDKDLNFLALRLSYIDTDLFVPYGGDKKKLRKKVLNAFQKKKYKKVLKLAEKVFETDFVDMHTHYMCMLASKKLEKSEKADFHEFIVTGLVDSITMGSNGKTPETAYNIITTREENFILTILGFTTVRREEMRKDGHAYDKIFVKDTLQNKEQVVYFNKDIPNKWLNDKYSPNDEANTAEDTGKE